MNPLEKRRTRQAMRTAERYHYKFIASYVQGKYREIYDEAQTMFTQAKVENPRVKDLTKTAFFLTRVHPDVVVPRYYNNRKLRDQSTTPQSKQMVLTIPLLSLPEVTVQQETMNHGESTTSQPPEDSIQQETMNHGESTTSQPPEDSIQQETMNHGESTTSQPPEDSIQQETMNHGESTTLQPPEDSIQQETMNHGESTTLQPSEDLMLPLQPEIYRSLFQDLMRDPDLQRILNDFSFNDMDVGEDIDGMNQHVQNDMLWQDDITPLEIDIQNTFEKLQ